MIIIYRATTNTVYTTCTEKGILTSPKYVIKFISDTKGSGDARYCLVTDSSSYPERYQTFSVVENNSPAQITNQVKLDISKSWKYTIFEVTNAYASSLTNWTQFSETGLTTVEKGRVRVLNSSASTTPTYSNYQTSYSEYDG